VIIFFIYNHGKLPFFVRKTKIEDIYIGLKFLFFIL